LNDPLKPRPEGKLRYHVPAVERAIALMEYLAVQARPQRLAEIAATVGLAKSTCFTILSTLENCGYVEQSATLEWSLTLKTYTVGVTRIRRSGWVDLIREFLEELQRNTGLTAHLGVLDGTHVVYVLKSTAPGLVAFNTYPGLRTSLHLTALGRAMCSSMSAEGRKRLLEGYRFVGGRENAPKSREAFELIVARAEARGFAIELEDEEEGVGCIAAPIRTGARVPAAIGITALAVHLGNKLDHLGQLVRDVAAEISEAIGQADPNGDIGVGFTGPAQPLKGDELSRLRASRGNGGRKDGSVVVDGAVRQG
jgi:IclR family acetate operon transcriptional repressor